MKKVRLPRKQKKIIKKHDEEFYKGIMMLQKINQTIVEYASGIVPGR